MIKFEEVAEIVESYPNTVAKGLFYIADKEAIKELKLEEEYKYKSNGISLNIGDNKVMIESHNIVPDGVYPDYIIKLYSMFCI